MEHTTETWIALAARTRNVIAFFMRSADRHHEESPKEAAETPAVHPHQGPSE